MIAAAAAAMCQLYIFVDVYRCVYLLCERSSGSTVALCAVESGGRGVISAIEMDGSVSAAGALAISADR